MSVAFKLTKSGKNVLTATNPNDFIFHSDYNTFKILVQGTLLNQPVNASQVTFTVTHNLGYIPTFYAFALFPDSFVALPNQGDYTQQSQLSDGYGDMEVQADSTKLYFVCDRFASSGSYNISIAYFIFEAPGS